MTREDIIKLAQECGHWSGQTVEMNDVGLERFAALVAAKKEKQIIDILRRLQKRNGSHNYYAYAINVIKGEHINQYLYPIKQGVSNEW